MAKDYNIARTSGECAACGNRMEAGTEMLATICESQQGDEDFVRRDFCPACAPDSGRPPSEAGIAPLAVWRTRVPEPREKKKLFVDDELLINFFQRLEGVEDPSKRDFRFVLALILMRKKLLIYQASEPLPEGGEKWTLRLKGADETYTVHNPQLDDERIAEVSEKLSDILEGEL